jgi:hypothetical protein
MIVGTTVAGAATIGTTIARAPIAWATVAGTAIAVAWAAGARTTGATVRTWARSAIGLRLRDAGQGQADGGGGEEPPEKTTTVQHGLPPVPARLCHAALSFP